MSLECSGCCIIRSTALVALFTSLIPIYLVTLRETLPAQIELFTDRSHLQMIEFMISCGIAVEFVKRLLKVKDRYMTQHNYNKNTWDLFLDATQTYEGVMQKLPLIPGSFETFPNIILNDESREGSFRSGSPLP